MRKLHIEGKIRGQGPNEKNIYSVHCVAGKGKLVVTVKYDDDKDQTAMWYGIGAFLREILTEAQAMNFLAELNKTQQREFSGGIEGDNR